MIETRSVRILTSLFFGHEAPGAREQASAVGTGVLVKPRRINRRTAHWRASANHHETPVWLVVDVATTAQAAGPGRKALDPLAGVRRMVG